MPKTAARQQKRRAGRFPLLATLRYLGQPEAQTFAFAVAANAILSSFPCMIVIITGAAPYHSAKPAIYAASEYSPPGLGAPHHREHDPAPIWGHHRLLNPLETHHVFKGEGDVWSGRVRRG